jgi:hypothetical protein
MIHNFMIENADKLRTAAMQRRNRGLSTGKSAKGWNFKPRDPEKGSWDYTVAVAKIHVRHAVAMAQEEYRRSVFPERFDDVTLDDVIAARAADADAALLATF